VGEEVSCRFPDVDVPVHLGVYGITEALHRDVQPLRDNVFQATAFLREAGVFSVSITSSIFIRRRTPLDSYLRLSPRGTGARRLATARCPPLTTGSSNRIAAAWSVRSPLASVAGSDAHTLRRVGRTWIEAPGTTREEFLESLKRGRGRPGGLHGGVPASAGTCTASSQPTRPALLARAPSITAAGIAPRAWRLWPRRSRFSYCCLR